MRLLPLLMLLASCAAPTLPPAKVAIPAFYTWKTTFRPGQWEVSTLQQWNAHRLYIKYADIDWREGKGAVPVATTEMTWDSLPGDVAVVPVYFIVNRAFSKLTENDCDLLAQKIIQHARTQTPVGKSIPEIQMDCDWSAATRDRYFYFLGQLKTILDTATFSPKPLLSATIRLHQIKFREKTGVPPVDRGLLMLYNFDSPTDTKVKNAILDPETAAQYLNAKTAPYPIPLDAALPLFGWGLHFRENDFQGFLHDFRDADAEKCSYLTRLKQNIFRVNTDTSCWDTYFRRGDWIRVEAADTDALRKVWNMAKPIIPNDTCHLVFFDLNTQNLQYYQHEALVQFFK